VRVCWSASACKSGGSVPTRPKTSRNSNPNQIYNWKKQLLDGASSVFEGGGSAVEGTASEAQVDLLYRQIGQLKVENDFLARKQRHRSPATGMQQRRRTGTGKNTRACGHDAPGDAQ
jgi:hypothetical protein